MASNCDSYWFLGLKKPPIEDEEDDEEDEDEDEEDDSEEEEMEQQPGVKVHLTPLELEGIWNLLGKLEALPTSKKSVPAGIHNAPALITHIKVVCMSECARTCVFVWSAPIHMAAPWCPAGATEGARQRRPQAVLHWATHRQVAQEGESQVERCPLEEGSRSKAAKARDKYLISSSSPPAALLVPASSSGPASSTQTGNHAHHPSAAEARLLHVCAEETQSQVRRHVCVCVLAFPAFSTGVFYGFSGF